MNVAIGLAFVLFFFLIVIAALYNNLVKFKNYIKESWSNVDTELKRRYNLIPNLVETVKGYAKHEKEVLQCVVEARVKALASTGKPASQAVDENVLISSLKSLLAVAEKYPDLKASGNFIALQKELINTEDRIQAARRFYNGNVRDYNNRVEMFPSSILANLFGFKREDFFEIEEAVRIAPEIKL
ncbi:MAG: LemA family protein [Planctomycetota bacterium]